MTTENYVPTLKKHYEEKVMPALQEKFGYKNVMQVPRLKKIVLSQGLGAAVADKRIIEDALNEMTIIAGQKAVPTKSKKDVSNFKLRKGMPIGARVTLRGERMYEFIERLIVASLPRIRDFRGVRATGFDGRGNYNLGVTEQIIFPEIVIDKVNRIQGMDITFVTSANTDAEAKALLEEFGIPFEK
jgi:large subunit ribosomal protein L5